METKRLYRSRSDVMLGGVCGGLAKYMNIDPTVIRLVFVLLLFIGGGGFWIYLILWFIMPVEPSPGTATVLETKSEKVEATPSLAKTENNKELPDAADKSPDEEKANVRAKKSSVQSAEPKIGENKAPGAKTDK